MLFCLAFFCRIRTLKGRTPLRKSQQLGFFRRAPRRKAEAPPRKGIPKPRAKHIRPFLLSEGRALFLSFFVLKTRIFIGFFNAQYHGILYHIPFSKSPRILCKMPFESPIQTAKIITFWAAVPHFTTFSLQHNEDVAYLTAHNEQLF